MTDAPQHDERKALELAAKSVGYTVWLSNPPPSIEERSKAAVRRIFEAVDSERAKQSQKFPNSV